MFDIAIEDVPEGWVWKRLENVSVGVYDCPHSTPMLTEAGPYVVRTQDILSGVFRADSAAHVSPETYLERTVRAVPRQGDLLYSREGTYFGIAAEVPPNVQLCLGQRMVLIRPDGLAVDYRFLRYWLNSPTMAAYIYGFRDGSVAERLNLPTIRTLPILLPPLTEQSAMAGVLGALDDKIAVNDSIISTADAMLKATFSAAAQEGNREVKLDGVISLRYGKALKEEDRSPGRVPVFGGNGVSGWHDTPLREGPGIIIGRKGANAGSVSWSPGPFWAIDTSFYVEPGSDGLPPEYLFFLLRGQDSGTL
jgi:type I restriction enzyme, S subunit